MLELDVTMPLGAFSLEVRTVTTARTSAVLGPSGAGKTSLLHAIAGLARPTRGRIVIDGDVVFDHAAGIDRPPHRRGVGVVFQDDRLFPHYSVAGNLAYGARGRRGERGVDQDAVIDLLELRPLLDRRPHRLSGGERRRVALGRALLAGPRVLLLDEPLTGLDRPLKAQVIPFLLRVRDALDVPVLFVSHDLEEILQMTDALILVKQGRVVGDGRYIDLVQEHPVLEAIGHGGVTNVLTLAPGGAPDLRLPGEPAVRREPVTVAIRAADIALSLERLGSISIQNQVRGTVRRMVEHGGRVLVEIDVGAPLLAEITPRAVGQLDVRPGVVVWCLIKSTAIRRLGA